MISKSARKGHSQRPGIFASRTNRNPWVSGMLLFGAFTLVALFSFELIGGLAFAQDGGATPVSYTHLTLPTILLV